MGDVCMRMHSCISHFYFSNSLIGVCVCLCVVIIKFYPSMFYRPEHAGWSKTQVARNFLTDINPSVRFRSFNYDLCVRYDDFLTSLRRGSLDENAPVDLLVCCVDNRAARLAVNEACHELNIPWICAILDSTSLKGSIQVVVPGRTACMQCASDQLEPIESPDTMNISLPSSHAVFAGMLSNLCLKSVTCVLHFKDYKLLIFLSYKTNFFFSFYFFFFLLYSLTFLSIQTLVDVWVHEQPDSQSFVG
jgi:molybdopterin/thiamine biosynthesis adenylyltransferase